LCDFRREDIAGEVDDGGGGGVIQATDQNSKEFLHYDLFTLVSTLLKKLMKKKKCFLCEYNFAVYI